LRINQVGLGNVGQESIHDEKAKICASIL